MIGHLQIQLIEDKNCKDNKWVVWKRNIRGESFVQYFLWNYVNNYSQKYWEENVIKLSKDFSKSSSLEFNNNCNCSHFRDTDVLRKFTLKEYIEFSQLLKMANFKYNKKTDEFTRI